ncbi:Aldo/keto reductase [Bimuria novae-zelandiae CBS 107.79]|uniref:Aldo/keto reductase n=1 Tax=Bimuria novae-zelandiae CBS 107.79 TaxID=1447943 RepID=A0A6A5UUV6_9PLEO|nr:Aldo/keto reductase [Bimuria novae-zelandiae CBS 107.79]
MSPNFPQRKLGSDTVSALGLGCMGMSFAYTSNGGYNDKESLKVLTRAVDLGITKFGNLRDAQGNPTIRGDKEYVHEACNASLERLGVDTIDLYYQHRVDPRVPIEEAKIRYLGLSECSATTSRRACKTARELGVKVVAYSPLGRGFLTGTIKSREDLDLKLVKRFAEMARRKGCAPGQLAIAWVLAQGEDIIPIPGAKRVKYLEENAKAVKVALSKEEEREIRKAVESVGGSKGDRYPPAMMKSLFGDSPELKQ